MKIERTRSTPEIEYTESTFIMTGVCTPENPPRFFELFQNEVEQIMNSPTPARLIFHLDYFNTGSSKCLYNMFKTLSQSHHKSSITITWRYEEGDDEMKESGELYSEISGFDFRYEALNKN